MKGFTAMENKFIVSSSPHIHKEEKISGIMLDVIIALMPATFMGVYYFGIRAAAVILTAIAASVISEYFYCRFMKKTSSVGDFSAIVTGLLIGLNMPPSVPLWMVVVGSAFAIIIVKMLYGGIGKNFLNPALCARCFMVVAWAGAMTTFVEPLSAMDAVSSATPLSVLKGSEGVLPSVVSAFWGKTAGCIGETSSVAIIAGGIYLLFRRVITWRIPVIMIIVFGVLEYFFGSNTFAVSQLEFTLLHIFSGGLMLGAFFMATDYTTTPTTKMGQIIFGVGCAFITFVIRSFGGYPEGVSFAILLMNLLTPLIDRYTIPKKFGYVKSK